ncbi:PREDICTED: trypsin-1-like [Dinoponera quadriceps]|uniref:Trypsin-1-like n=1 Tax=Dinoponera quadriceps TaxID=609295 RepID=A0A6P3WMC8_DINQU|nr:PREDICTED: trypsin-1-like [Dinoponera quadriceps]
MQYFMLISLSFLILGCANAWPRNRGNQPTDTYHVDANYGCECGRKDLFRPASRIIGGREAYRNEFPWMASIISVNRSGQHICGASVINDRYVITAAHCIPFGFDKDDLKVSVGTHSSCQWDETTTIFSVEEIFPHPSYDRQTNFADIMLVKLMMRITFNQYVKPICLPKSECGESGGISNRIVGGIITIAHLFPWVVAIFNGDQFHCGGTLINNRYVLTAGHCVRWTSQADLSLGLGMHDIERADEGILAEVDKVIIHEDFESDYIHDTNDIALIRLKAPVQFNENVKPVCLPHKGSDYTGHNAQVIGWGRVTTKGDASRFLRQATLKIMSHERCRNTSFGEHVTTSMICAYNDDTDACQGDSGGPLLYGRLDGKYEMIGVVSWGIGCAKRGIPGVYVKITDYLNWIRRNSRDAVFCADS